MLVGMVCKSELASGWELSSMGRKLPVWGENNWGGKTRMLAIKEGLYQAKQKGDAV